MADQWQRPDKKLIRLDMRHFTSVKDLGDLHQALQEALEIKRDRFKNVELGRNKTLLMVFFNSSLRTRLSTQRLPSTWA